MQKNGNLTNDRIHGYMYIRKKILTPLVLQPAPSLIRTSLPIADRCEQCLHTANSYEATAAWGAELQSGTQCVGAYWRKTGDKVIEFAHTVLICHQSQILNL